MQQQDRQGSGPVEVTARYYDCNTSAASEVRLFFGNAGLITITGTGLAASYSIADITVSSRLGNTPRSLYLPDGSLCEVSDNDLLDQLLGSRLSGSQNWLHRLESRTLFVLLAVGLTLFTTLATFEHGIPWLAMRAANALPQSVDRHLGQGTLELMDRTLLSPSTLGPTTRQRLRTRFGEMTAVMANGTYYRLEFRHGEKIGANAFALPSGIVVMTDELVELSQNDDELVAILAHEIGHLEHRHSIRMAMQGSAVALIIATITGDAVSTSTLVVALPTVLIHSSYSQEFEREADDYAYRYLVNSGIDTAHFGHILSRISGDYADKVVDRYLSSHPGTRDRTSRFLQND